MLTQFEIILKTEIITENKMITKDGIINIKARVAKLKLLKYVVNMKYQVFQNYTFYISYIQICSSRQCHSNII